MFQRKPIVTNFDLKSYKWKSTRRILKINQKDTEIAELKQAREQLELELSTMVNNSEADVLRDRIRALENEKLEYQDATKRMAEDVQVKIDELSDIVTENAK